MLDRDATRRRVSIDYLLSDEQLEALTLEDGVVVPISVLTKEPRKSSTSATRRAAPFLSSGASRTATSRTPRS
jgi:hypothetical protein